MAVSLALLLFVAGGRMLAEQKRQNDDGQDSLYKYLAIFSEVLSLVDRAYVDKLESEMLLDGAFEGTLDALDPFSMYVPADRAEEYRARHETGVRHSGLLVLKERGVAYVAAVEEGSPAALAGIERDYILASLQNRPTRPMPLYEIRSILAGPPGAEITVERIFQGQKEAVRFTLGEYPPPALELSVRRGVAVLRVPSFYAGVAADARTAVETMHAGSPELPALTEAGKLVVDVRGAAGGSAEAAYRIADLFASGELGALRVRDNDLETFEGSAEPLWRGKIVVLVDRSTQGPAEILATVLRQSAGATLVGDRSFGYCGRQKWVTLSSGDQLLITDAFYTGPDREPIRSSLQPDLWVRPVFGAPETEEDEALERGLEVLFEEADVEERQAA